MSDKFLGLAAGICGLAVIMGAFGAHALNDLLVSHNKVETYKTAVLYHIFHGLAMLIVGFISKQGLIEKVQVIQLSFLIGIILFSGSLYVLAITNTGIIGAITPFGGIAFIVGWLFLAIDFYKK